MATKANTSKGGSQQKSGSTNQRTGTGSAQKGGAKPKAAQGKTGTATKEKLQELFVDELKDIYWAEKALTKALPKMAKNATAEELVTALENHLEETNGHIERLEQVFEILGEKAQAKKCEAMAGLIKEAEELMQDNDKGAMRDAAIISAGQKVEHYEIATYGTLRAFAEKLGLDEEVAELLEQTLDEEKAADEKLTEVTSTAIMMDESEETEEEDEDSDDEK